MTDLVRSKLSQSLEVKSLDDLLRARTSETAFLAIDYSGSMSAEMRNGKSRIEGLREAVKEIQGARETKMIGFGGAVGWVPNVPSPSGGTPLTEAIEFARKEEAGRLVVISDGQPNNPTTALEAAKRFGGRIDVIFVGDPGDPGKQFLADLAAATGGSDFQGDLSEPKQLAKGVVGLLSTGTIEKDDDEEDEE